MTRIPILLPALIKKKQGSNGYFVYFKDYLQESANGDAENEGGKDQKAVKRKANTDSDDYGDKKSKQDNDSKENGKFW